MFQTTLSLASTKAASLIGAEIGLMKSSTMEPVLCLGALAKVASKAASSGGIASDARHVVGDVVGVVGDVVGDVAGDAIDAVGDFFSSIFYLSPGRMSAVGTQIAENASVEELISVTRGAAA